MTTTLNQSSSDSILVPFSRNSEYGERWSLGLDLGKERDYTALVAIRRLDRSSENKPPLFQVTSIRRWELGTLYPQIVLEVREILSRHFRGATLIIDKTGVGSAIADLFEITGVSPIKVTITGGDKVTCDGREWHVPKNELISCVGAALHADTLYIHSEIPRAKILESELMDFQTKHTSSGYMTHNAREGAHDDMVLGLAIALFHADDRGPSRSFSNWMTFMQRQAGWGVTDTVFKHQPALVKLQRPNNNTATTLFTITGEKIDIGPDGVIEVAGDQATALLRDGWTQIEATP